MVVSFLFDFRRRSFGTCDKVWDGGGGLVKLSASRRTSAFGKLDRPPPPHYVTSAKAMCPAQSDNRARDGLLGARISPLEYLLVLAYVCAVSEAAAVWLARSHKSAPDRQSGSAASRRGSAAPELSPAPASFCAVVVTERTGSQTALSNQQLPSAVLQYKR